MKTRPPVYFVLTVTIAFAVGMLTMIKMPCPTCGGKGVLPAPAGLTAQVIDSQLTHYQCFEPSCEGVWGIFNYDVHFQLINDAASTVYGYLIVDFYTPGESPLSLPALKMPVYVEVPAKTTEVIERTLVYSGLLGDAGYDPYSMYPQPQHLEVEIGGNMPCPECGGTDKLSFTEWLKIVL